MKKNNKYNYFEGKQITDPDTGKRIGKNEAYSKVGTTIDPETGRRKDIGDTGKRTKVGILGVKQELASSKYDVGTTASRAMFREEAGIGFDEELKGKQFRKTRRQLARQQRKRERINKRAQRIEQRAIGETNKKQARLKRKAARVRDKYEGPRLEDFDKTADFYDYTRMEDFARESRNQQAENEIDARTTRLKVLKNRYTGETGVAGHIIYEPVTGRLNEVDNGDIELAGEESSI